MSGDRRYKVIVNHEEQFKVWPAATANPRGWSDAGKTGTRDECIDHVEKVWTDMRPRNWREYVLERP
jgi:MbtH protein